MDRNTVAAEVAARLAQKGVSPHRLVASLRSAQSGLSYAQLRSALSERALAFEASSQAWERLLRLLDPASCGAVEMEALIELLLRGDELHGSVAAAAPHPMPQLASRLAGGACLPIMADAAEGGAAAARRAALRRLGRVVSADSQCGLLLGLRRADAEATGAVSHTVLAECFAAAGVALEEEECLAFCQHSTMTARGDTVAYQELLEDIDQMRVAAVEKTAAPTTTPPGGGAGLAGGAAAPVVEAVLSDLTGARLRRPSRAQRALMLQGAAGHR